MKKLSHSFAKVSHSYKKGVALVGMRHLKTAFINILYFCSYCFFKPRYACAFFLAFVLTTIETIETIFFSYRNFCFNDNRDNFFYVLWKNKTST